MKWLPLLVIFVSAGIAQESARDTVSFPEQMLEELLGEEPEEGIVLDQADELVDLYENPLDLGRSTMRELERIPGITPLLAYRIVSMRERKPFSSVTELLEIEGITEELYRAIVPFVTVRHGLTGKSSAKIRSRVRRDLNEKRGFRDGVYAGTKENILHRLDAVLEVGREIMVEGRLQTHKEAGEPMKTAFRSGYLRAEAPLVTVVVGDMKVETGRRLLLGRAPMARAVDLSVSRRTFLSGYRSSDETAFLRGIGFEARPGPGVAIGGFYSNRPMHGAISGEGVFTPVSDGGLFRTLSEQSKRNTSRERASGVSVSLSLTNMLMLTAAVTHVRFQHPVALAADGRTILRELAGASLSAWFSTRGVTGTGEVAVIRGGGRAGSASFLLEPTNAMRAGIAGNVFDPSFRSPLGLPARGEIGLEAWTDVRPSKGWKISVALLNVWYPGGRNGNEFGEEVRRWRAGTSVRVSGRHEITIEYSVRQSPAVEQRVNAHGLAETYRTIVGRHHVRGTVAIGEGRRLQWISRIELVEVRESRGRGVLLSQQCRWWGSENLFLEGKLTIFGTASYDARLYAMEPDVPGAFASRVVTGDGTRAAVLVRVRPIPRLELSCSYSIETKDGQRSLGSGFDEVQGDHRSTVSIQADFRL